ncbi:MAG: hypothetical protein EOM12_16665 [Verrucomicrobiae bacterium]|nr:hypothetical protein [Verrucomicrobiae bacterium]
MSKHKSSISVHSVDSSEAGGKEIAVLNLVENFGCGSAAPGCLFLTTGCTRGTPPHANPEGLYDNCD